ncbi:MAG: sigma 54 modulation/S30EA ribosomal C-terminal domain-containing protein [Actinomycetota bacterium]
MTTGRVRRIDEERGVVHVVRRGRIYPAPLAEVEAKARVPGALVEFRIVRHCGEEGAIDVRLRSGTRTNRRQRRFGDLTGARRPGAKVSTLASERYGIDPASAPFDVVDAWLEAMADRDLDGAAALYEPDARVHHFGGDVAGRRSIRAVLEGLAFVAVDPGQIEVYGLGRYVRADVPADRPDLGTAFVVERGAIVEQWLDGPPPGDDVADRPPPPRVILRGVVPGPAEAYADRRIRHLVETVGRPVRFCRIKLTGVDNPASERPCVVEAVLDLDRTIVRTQADAPSFTEAVDRVVERLQVRLDRQRGRYRTRQRGRVEAHEPGPWPPTEGDRRFGPAGVAGADTVPARPEIVRHRSFVPDELTVEEAAWDLDLLDYDFLLFVEAETGDDALLARDGDGRLVLHFRHGPPDPPTTTEPGITIADEQPWEQTVAEAIDLLAGTGERQHFFVESVSGRGNVIYRRLDGQFGLITPPES